MLSPGLDVDLMEQGDCKNIQKNQSNLQKFFALFSSSFDDFIFVLFFIWIGKIDINHPKKEVPGCKAVSILIKPIKTVTLR